MLEHLKLVLPAAAALVWVLGKFVPRGESAKPAPAVLPAEEDDGEAVQVELPSGKGPQLPFVAPPPFRCVLLDVTLPLSLAAVWLALFHNASTLLSDFHAELGDRDVSVSQWRRQKGGDKRRRMLRYTTPLKNALGPRQAFNTEVLEVVQLSAGGFVLSGRCDTEGVPFASAFANHMQWVAMPHGAHSCRLVITGECQFHSPVWGPLKGQIDRESVKGMGKAYRTLVRMLERQYGGVEAGSAGSSIVAAAGGAPPSKQLSKLSRRQVAVGADARVAGPAVVPAGDGNNVAAMLANPQANAAVFLAIVMIMLVIWRLAFMQPLLLQAMRTVAQR